MAKTPASTPKESTVLGMIFWGILKLIIWTILGWCLALVISVGLLIFSGKEQGLIYLNQLWLANCQVLKINAQGTWLWQQPISQALAWNKTVTNDLFIKTHIIESVTTIKDIKVDNQIIQHFIKSAYPVIKDYLQVLILTTAIVVMRLITVLLFLPLFLLLGTVGLVDGLVQRDLRRLGGGRESALLYHRARQCVLPCLQWSCFLFLVLPFAIKPELLLIPFAILFSIALFFTAKTFKKYV